MQSERIMASDVIHLYRIKRPGQMHGIPWFTPVLDKFAQFRRFTDATLDSAETAAKASAVVSCKDPDSDSSIKIAENDVLEIERNGMYVLPDNYEMTQFKPEHPAATYEMFKAEIINEIARCVLMPYNIAAMNSSKYNYASGRLDHQKYHRFISTIRTWGEKRFLNRVFAEWLSEAYLLDGFFISRPTFEQVMKAIRTIRWFWPGFEHVDPSKEANSDDIRFKNGSLTLEDYYAARGQDWQRKMKQRAKELQFMRDHDIPIPDVRLTTLTVDKKDNEDEADDNKTNTQEN
jgi:lambda family phage portal protein